MKYALPETVMLRGVPVCKRREGDMVRVIAGPFNTTCLPLHVWEVMMLLVAAVESRATCPQCGRVK